MPLGIEQQLAILLTSKGAAAVSGGALVAFTATVTSIGMFPLEGLAVIFGVYRFLSMAIAVYNTIGNGVAVVVVARWAGTLDARMAQRHLYPERHPESAAGDAAHAGSEPLPEGTRDGDPHPAGIALQPRTHMR